MARLVLDGDIYWHPVMGVFDRLICPFE